MQLTRRAHHWRPMCARSKLQLVSVAVYLCVRAGDLQTIRNVALHVRCRCDCSVFRNFSSMRCSDSFCSSYCQSGHTIVWNGRKKIGLEYGMVQVWNGRFDVWNGTNLPYSIQIPYLRILTWCCWSPVFLSVKHSCKQSLSSTRTVIRKLRAFFVISVTKSNVDAKRTSLILILFSWGQGTLSPDFLHVYFRAASLPLCKTR